ncbi:MAG: porin, partial [Methyloceanibacter sp.]|uniref:porin n=1 Tax=Methyloceanibacter sp. TaxID=1965321 RepID=UPI003EDFA435
NWYDSGFGNGFAVGDKDYDLASRFAITGSATIAPGWSAGYNMTITAPGSTFGVNSNSVNEYAGVNSRLGGTTYGTINTLYSYMYVKSDTYGTLNWGHLSPASDNPAVLADISGTVIESNAVLFEGGGLQLRPSGAAGAVGAFNHFLLCSSAVAPGADCFGAAEEAVRYDSPTFGGFRIEASYGTANVVPAILDNDSYLSNSGTGLIPHPNTSDSNFADIAAFYNGDWGNFKISAAYAYTWLEANPLNGGEQDYHQVGGTVMHVPSGLGIYALGNWEFTSGPNGNLFPGGAPLVGGANLPNTDSWGVKPFIKRTWNPLGATILYGEYYQYNDMYGLANVAGPGGNVASALPNCPSGLCNVVGSEVERWGLGAVQEIDSAAMHLFARWQHLDGPDVTIVDTTTGTNFSQGFEDNDLFQVGGIIFF